MRTRLLTVRIVATLTITDTHPHAAPFHMKTIAAYIFPASSLLALSLVANSSDRAPIGHGRDHGAADGVAQFPL